MGEIEELQQKVKVNEAILMSVGDGLIVVNKSLKIVLINPVACQMLQWEAKDAVGLDFSDVVPAADESGKLIPKDERPILAVLKMGTTFSNHTANFYIRKDNTRFPAAITTAPIIYENSTLGAIITFRDITRNAEINRMKNEFIALASHQLRTPLSALKWYSELLLHGDSGPLNPEQKEFVNNIYDSSIRMIDLVNDLLNIARIESGRITIDSKPCDLGELLQGIIDDVKPKIEAKNQKIILNISSDLAKVNLDRNFIRVVYLNLLTNANKYTPVYGTIAVNIFKKDGQIISQVKDNGYGIPEKEKPFVFQKFFRGSNVSKIVVEGTGLGLYLAKAIVEASKGKIWFESSPLEGTTFSFSLPLTGIPSQLGHVAINA